MKPIYVRCDKCRRPNKRALGNGRNGEERKGYGWCACGGQFQKVPPRIGDSKLARGTAKVLP